MTSKKTITSLFISTFFFFYSFATTEYFGTITIDNGIGNTITNEASIILLEDNDSVSFIIHNLRIHSGDQYVNVGNIHISSMKTFNLRGIKATASKTLFTVTEGDITLPDNAPWLPEYFPPEEFNVTSLFDDNDLILRFQYFTYSPNMMTFTVQFSTPGSNIPVIKGDINRDGIINSIDISELYNILLNE